MSFSRSRPSCYPSMLMASPQQDQARSPLYVATLKAAVRKAILSSLDGIVSETVAHLLQENVPIKKKTPRPKKQIDREQVTKKLERASSRMKNPAFYNIHSNRVNGDSPQFQMKYPRYQFQRHRDLALCGTPTTMKAFCEKLSAPRLSPPAHPERADVQSSSSGLPPNRRRPQNDGPSPNEKNKKKRRLAPPSPDVGMRRRAGPSVQLLGGDRVPEFNGDGGTEFDLDDLEFVSESVFAQYCLGGRERASLSTELTDEISGSLTYYMDQFPQHVPYDYQPRALTA